MKKYITLLSVLLITQVFAQAPQKMSYQAVLRNTSNALITNTIVGMRISILQGNATGTAVYVETQNPTTNVNGLVSLEIGGGSAVTGTFSGINWATGSFFVKTETDPTGGTNYTITGTSQLLSVPYALYSQSSRHQGKTTIVLEDDITDAQAATQIAQELGPNTENIIINNTTQLTTVNFSAVTSLLNLTITENSSLNSLNFNSLLRIYGGQNILIYNNPSLTSLTFPSLIKLQQIQIQSNQNLASVSFPSLIAVSGFSLTSDNLVSVFLPLLAKAGTINIYNSPISTISFPSLITAGSINIAGNQLNSINITSLTNSDNFLALSNKFSSSTINSILQKFLTITPTSGKVINLSQQSPLAPPTGQGIVDKATLINSGNNVTTD